MSSLESGVLHLVRQGIDLTTRQLGMLFLCQKGPKTVRGLGEELKINRPSVTRAADKLEDMGFVRRQPDPDDRRSVLIEVTGSGRKFINNIP